MDLQYTLYTDPQEPECLRADLIGETVPTTSVFAVDERDEQERELRAERVPLGTLLYPEQGAPETRLPPLLLIEARDDPDTAEERYAEYGGLRFVGQLLLADGWLGEGIQVTVTQEALSLWHQREGTSPLHQRAHQRRARQLAALFQLPSQDDASGTDDLTEQQHDRLRRASLLLQEAERTGKLAALELLDGVPAPALPLSSLFPCLNDPSPVIRQQAEALLSQATDRLPLPRLRAIVQHAALPARLSALALLGKMGGYHALAILLAVVREREHAWERRAALRALATLERTGLHSVDVQDLLEEVLIASTRDPVIAVRQEAMEVLEHLGGLAQVMAELASLKRRS